VPSVSRGCSPDAAPFPLPEHSTPAAVRAITEPQGRSRNLQLLQLGNTPSDNTIPLNIPGPRCTCRTKGGALTLWIIVWAVLEAQLLAKRHKISRTMGLMGLAQLLTSILRFKILRREY
jgi:hypothetical protein